MRVEHEVKAETYEAARMEARPAFDAFFGAGNWRFDDSSGRPAEWALGNGVPLLWDCEFAAVGPIVGPVEK